MHTESTETNRSLLYKDLTYKIRGAAMETRKALGPGHKEIIYQNAFAEELASCDLKVEREKAIKIYLPKTGKFIGLYRPDFLVENKVIVEIKAVDFIPKNFIDQIYSYLKNSEYQLGLFINFRSQELYIKRVIYTNDRKLFLKSAKSV